MIYTDGVPTIAMTDETGTPETVTSGTMFNAIAEGLLVAAMLDPDVVIPLSDALAFSGQLGDLAADFINKYAV